VTRNATQFQERIKSCDTLFNLNPQIGFRHQLHGLTMIYQRKAVQLYREKIQRTIAGIVISWLRAFRFRKEGDPDG